ncbi:hypothetical protein KTC96_24715 (plasmid) [Clostridium estertheticum]|uniref:phage baseplate protein n=1 Tax=Clostridium estertheticum TaxID=238834 RepID=UPI001C7D87A7|nr:hypothetical protein [Clostridium estertheticum]MBX4259731.1 hypothetical protein [Clostridium estertheticum]WLC73318.1 hypothetical protein KTC96_24715 [Clostridium estertheticum]
MGTVRTYFNTAIGDFVFDAYFSIDHETNLKITEQPVQIGASISDHAYMEANQVIFDIGMSDVMKSIVDGQFSDNDSRSVSAYTTLRKLQAQRLPIQVVTRLATYENMLIATISSSDDKTNTNGLRVTVTLQQIIVVQVSTIKISARAQVSSSTNNGDQRVQRADSSILSGLLK